MTQLSLVEHALCPLDPDVSLKPGLVHEAAYFFTDKASVRRKASARVVCAQGLSAYDELYLWGLLALTFSQPEPSLEFTATPHYCLRQLGLIEDKYHRGGETYRLFRDAIERLSTVSYLNDNFYDPIRSEHCQVSFGFFGYRLPLNTDSSRAWRFYWDQQFFELCQASGSALAFDLGTYRALDTATRRLYLLLKKMFWKRKTSLRFDVRRLAVDVLGFSGSRATWDLKRDVATCVGRLVEHGILQLPINASIKDLFQKPHKGQFTVMLHRGPHFDRSSRATRDVIASPQFELLETIGFDATTAARILRDFPSRLVSEWADITLAARERQGERFFKKSPQAYFMDNIKHAAIGKRTPPDWWRELRRQEEQQQRRQAADNVEATLDKYLRTEARETFARVTQRIFGDLVAAGKDQAEAGYQAERIARATLRSQFFREHPECRPPENDATPNQHSADEC